MFLWHFSLFNSAASFTKRDFESMDSTLLLLLGYYYYSSYLKTVALQFKLLFKGPLEYLQI
jgi:hypothetical protein